MEDTSRIEKFCEEAEFFANRGLNSMTRNLYPKDIRGLRDRGFKVIEVSERTNCGYCKCLISWAFERDLNPIQLSYVCVWDLGSEIIPDTQNFAEKCALVALRANAKKDIKE